MSKPATPLTLDQALAKLPKGSKSEQGESFEKLVKFFLENDPLHSACYRKIYLWRQWRRQRGEPTQDIGIDLVAEDYSGGTTAIQAKFYEDNTPVSRADIDTFFTASGAKPFTHRLFIATTGNWSSHAEAALKNQTIPCRRISRHDMQSSPINWQAFFTPAAKKTKPPHQPGRHQRQAIADVCQGLQSADRGKLIMACGAGKTFTALKIAEQLVPAGGHVLFLVPSLSLLSQALHEWSAQAARPLRQFAVCSDSRIGRENEDIALHDLALPATTSAKALADKLAAPFEEGGERLNVIFCTYHSIDTIIQAQKKHAAPAFDLAICDEAHRTSGAAGKDEQGETDESYYLKIHDNANIKASKRLYMTATPRIYSPDSRAKALEENVPLYSMDDPACYGEELHRLGFADAVAAGLLADYKVLVLGVNEDAAAGIANLLPQDDSGALTASDSAKIIGCWNGLAKKFANPDGTALNENEKHPMRRAVIFANTIKKSTQIKDSFNEILARYRSRDDDGSDSRRRLRCEVRHIDGGMNAIARADALQWLKDGDSPADSDSAAAAPRCRILSNAKCLTEGVDVPALDAVMFLQPRKSQVDVVQSVGRVMRRAPGKQYGYVILPVVIPPDKKPEEALNSDPQAYKVVWQVLQALRAHDERFNAMINSLELNKNKPKQISIIGVDSDDGEAREPGEQYQPGQGLLIPEWSQWQDAILARIVTKCGSKDYWEKWAADVAGIAAAHIARIRALLDSADDKPREKFAQFLARLQKNLNPSVSEDDAIEMLSQHLITRPVFDALFEGYAFAAQNPVSQSMQQMLDILEKHGLQRENERLQKFYKSVQTRASGIDNAAGKQKIMVELYEKFFATAFKKQSEKLGIVYTPVEIVDFILDSADQALRREFSRALSHKDVHILDPFTGTGTFIARLLREDSPLIAKKDLARKYAKELHANEITLLSYYIAAVNIEEVYHHRSGADYQPFGGIVLTDTFQLSESGSDTLSDEILQENSARAKRQHKKPIQVIIGNPPYSAGQKSANDNNQNQAYPALDKRIAATYAKDVAVTNKNSLYDSYIRSIRWASDRIKDDGVIAFVTNGSFIDSNATAGLRKHLLKDFSAVYCFNLRGNARTQGEQRRKERGNVFGEGTRTPVAVTLLIKKRGSKEGRLYYHDIGDYLTLEEKLDRVKEYGHYGNIEWQTVTPNQEGDWINQRHPEFLTYLPMEDNLFTAHSRGIETTRDAWVYDFSKAALAKRIREMTDFYNSQVAEYHSGSKNIDHDKTSISWSRSLKKHVERKTMAKYSHSCIRLSMYRPFTKQHLYLDSVFVDLPAAARRYFPTPEAENLLICVPGAGGTKEFSALMVDTVPDLSIVSASQCFPLYHYVQSETGILGKSGGRQDNIPDATLKRFQTRYKDHAVTKEDIFYYVYGILHSPQYKQRYAADLGKMLPRIPEAKSKTAFVQFADAGRRLAALHLSYETAPEYPVQEQHSDLYQRNYTVDKMRFAGRQGARDKTAIIYNSHITLTGIPLEAYDYQVNGKSAIEWIMDRYQQKQDKDTGIKTDPNQWSQDDQYILSLLKRVIHTSAESAKIIKSLPDLEI